MPIVRKAEGVQKRSATGMIDVVLDYNVDPEPPMGPLVADEMGDWISDGLRHGYIVDVTPRKPLRLPEIAFEMKGRITRKE